MNKYTQKYKYESYKIHQILKRIAIKAFPDINLLPFFVELNSKKLRSKYGDYSFKLKKIRIFIIEGKSQVAITSIHELAHHVDYCINGISDHSKRFYIIYKKLIEKALELFIVDYADFIQDSDYSKIKTKVGDVVNPCLNNEMILYLVVRNGYYQREYLNQAGYKYSGIDKTWCLKINESQIQTEICNLKQYGVDNKMIRINKTNSKVFI